MHPDRNCQCRLTRRDALRTMGAGFGMVGSGEPVQREMSRRLEARSNPRRRISRQSQARHFPVPQRRPLAGRHLRSQADAHQVQRQAHAFRQPEDRAQDRQSAGIAVQFQEDMARAESRSARSFRKLGECIDDVCVIRSMYTDRPNHEPSLFMMNMRRQVARAPVHGLLADLRAGNRESEPTRIHRAVPRARPWWVRSSGLPRFCPAVYQATYIPNNETSRRS